MQQLNDSMANMNMSNGQQQPPSRMPSLNGNGNPPPGPYPPRSAPPGQQSYGPGQIMPGGPARVMSPNGYGPQGQGQGMNNFNSFGGPGPNGYPPQQQQQFGPGQVIPPPRGMSYNSSGPGTPVRGSSYSDGPSPPPHMGGRMQSQSPYPPSSSSRPPSDGSSNSGLRKSTSSRSLGSQYDNRQQYGGGPPPPMPAYPDGLAPPHRPFLPRTDSSSSLQSLPASIYGGAPMGGKPLPPSATYNIKSVDSVPTFADPSPPSSPVAETKEITGPTTTAVTQQGKCKVFLKEQHAKWKSLGAARLKLYHESPTNVKQLVVETDNNKKAVLISTIILPDGVERVGRTGVAVELTDKGLRTGIVYMLQLKDEKSAGSLFDSLLAGSDRFEAN